LALHHQQARGDWTKPEFDASSWKEGPASFGTDGHAGRGRANALGHGDIWLRRNITLPDKQYSGLQFYVDHDEDVEIYVNGVLAAKERGFTTSYVTLGIRLLPARCYKPNATVTLAVHCHQTEGRPEHRRRPGQRGG
jgi:hypothetical protein